MTLHTLITLHLIQKCKNHFTTWSSYKCVCDEESIQCRSRFFQNFFFSVTTYSDESGAKSSHHRLWHCQCIQKSHSTIHIIFQLEHVSRNVTHQHSFDTFQIPLFITQFSPNRSDWISRISRREQKIIRSFRLSNPVSFLPLFRQL